MNRLSLVTVAASLLALSPNLHAGVVLSNSPAGDLFVNGSTASQGEALTNAPGFFYNNVRNGGYVGINDTFTRNGNGSAFLRTSIGPGGNSSKADFELLADGVDFGGNFFASGTFGRLGDLTDLSYEWYRGSASSNNAGQHPVIRILVDADGDLNTISDRGGLVFEQAYNGANVPINTWVFEDIFAYNSGAGANLWTFGAGMLFAQEGYGNTLTDWVNGVGTISADSQVLGFSIGVGSGWGPFVGATDTLTVGFDGVSTTYNFEVIPEPASLTLLGLGSLMMLRRRHSA